MDKIKHADGRFYLNTAHGNAELLYRIDAGIMSVYRTFVPEEERGAGIAERLSDAALEMAKAKGLRIRPDCSYMKHYIEKHSIEKRYIASEGDADACEIQ